MLRAVISWSSVLMPLGRKDGEPQTPRAHSLFPALCVLTLEVQGGGHGPAGTNWEEPDTFYCQGSPVWKDREVSCTSP